jgi:hypothetical protein
MPSGSGWVQERQDLSGLLDPAVADRIGGGVMTARLFGTRDCSQASIQPAGTKVVDFNRAGTPECSRDDVAKDAVAGRHEVGILDTPPV